MVGLLDSDEEDDYLRDAGLDNTIFSGSDDELGFEEEEVDNVSDSEGEEYNKRLNCKQLDTNRLIYYSATTSIYRTINETIDSGHEVSSNIPLVACLLASYPSHVGGERRPGIDCLRMCNKK